jgi:hypothetical protein
MENEPIPLARAHSHLKNVLASGWKRTLAVEVGKPLSFVTGDPAKGTLLFEIAVTRSDRFLGPVLQSEDTDGKAGHVVGCIQKA